MLFCTIATLYNNTRHFLYTIYSFVMILVFTNAIHLCVHVFGSWHIMVSFPQWWRNPWPQFSKKLMILDWFTYSYWKHAYIIPRNSTQKMHWLIMTLNHNWSVRICCLTSLLSAICCLTSKYVYVQHSCVECLLVHGHVWNFTTHYTQYGCI